MIGKLIKISEIKNGSMGKYQWLHFKMKDNTVMKTWVYHSHKNYDRMWKMIINIGIGCRLKNLQKMNKELINPNSDMIIIPVDMEDDDIIEVNNSEPPIKT